MKGKTKFGYKFLFFAFAVIAIANATARSYHYDYDPSPDPLPDSPAVKKDTLKFPIYDHFTNDPLQEQNPSSIDLNDPSNVNKVLEYDGNEKKYFFNEKIGNDFIRNPSYLTLEEYLKYRGAADEKQYWRRRIDALSQFSKKPQLPTMNRDGVFDRIFGGTGIQVRPQGNVDVTFGGHWQNIKNPMLVQRAQKYGVFDFDMQMNINLVATIGDKMKLNISNNTKATFDYQNVQKLEYSGKEDEIIKKLEAGNISFPLKSSLIHGVQSLFGVKAQLQFGKLWVTGVVSQQKSKKHSLTVQGGAQTQQFSIKADDYEENKHFFLAQYFRNHYNTALKSFPIINSTVTINKIEVWVTNRTGAVDGVRDIVGFMDLGEKNPYNNTFLGGPVQDSIADNRSNQLYNMLQQYPDGRMQANATAFLTSNLGLNQNVDFVRVTARKLNTSEFYMNPQLGYISLNTNMNTDDILAVAYRYTCNGKVFQVGEFAEDLPPDSSHTKVMYMKLLKGVSSAPRLPIWKLMMKNVYALGGLGVSKEDFRLNVLYQNPGGGDIRYLPDGPHKGQPLISLLNLDRLNAQNDPQSDGIFDFVEGITINTQQGKIIFPVIEPFGSDLLPAVGDNPQLQRKYLYQILYDSTKTVARQFQQNNRFLIKGTYKSSSSSEIFLGGFNIPHGSVVVAAGGQKLVENRDYQIDYGLGRVKIINTGILASGIPISIQYEDNAAFGFQQQNFLGARFDYYLNKNLTLGGTYMRLSERPFTHKTTFGDDPIKNTVLGLDASYQSEAPGITRALDRLPFYSTTATSIITASGEVAGLFPSHPKQINSLDPEGAVYIDDFEGTRSGIDLRLPSQTWSLASTPVGARDASGSVLFPEATLNSNLEYDKNRAKLAWYSIEPTLIDGVGGIPDFVKKDPDQHYIRLAQQQEVFPQKSSVTLQSGLSTFDVAYYPREKGPYNFDVNVDQNGKLLNPSARWAGIQRAIDYSDFEQSNVEFIEFWLLDPFINKQASNGGNLYINLGNVSEDVLKDSRKFFENGIPYPKDNTKLESSVWGFVPGLQTQIIRAFDNDPNARAVQDVGFDGMDDAEEQAKFAPYLNSIQPKVSSTVYSEIQADPSNDDYHYFRGSDYDQKNAGVLERYKKFNNPSGNSPVTSASQTFSNAATNIPDAEDINRDNTLNESEDYFQYRVAIQPSKMTVGSNFIVNSVTTNVKLPNGSTEPETWYQFKIPIREYQNRVGNISDFRSIRFLRLFLNGFDDSVIMRFARFELGRNQWRRYMFSLQSPGENIPIDDNKGTEFSVQSVSLEENSQKTPVNYVIPPGVERQQAQVTSGQNIVLNEQSLSLQVCGLNDGDARSVFKEVNVDMRQFGRVRMFVHAESKIDQVPLKDGDLYFTMRIGSDFVSNYYEYQIPLKITAAGSRDATVVWPKENMVDLLLDNLVSVKTSRNSKKLPSFAPYSEVDEFGNNIVVVGNPNIGEAKTIMLGVLNPKRNSQSHNDDGLPKCVEVWLNELRMTGMNEAPGYAAMGKVNVQLADLGLVKLGGSMHTQGYGNIDQKINQRFRDNFYQYDASTNLNVGKLMPKNWGIQLPVFAGYSQSISNPKYDPYDLDVKLQDKLNEANSQAQRDSMRKAAQDFTAITSFNVTNVRVLGNQEKGATSKPKPWSIKNFDMSYAYNKQFKRNPLIDHDQSQSHKLGLGYAYTLKAKPIEPFKTLIKSRSKWLNLIRDFNFNPIPTSFGFKTELNRVFNETQLRNVGGDVTLPPSITYFKNFTWMRDYTTRWEIARSISIDYHATNQARIDEPYGLIDTKEKKDTLLERFLRFGRNTSFVQTLGATYNMPTSKLPLTDWTTARLTYNSTFNWAAASLLARSLGNTMINTQNIQINSEFDFRSLYNKNKLLRAFNQPKSGSSKIDPRSGGGKDQIKGVGGSKDFMGGDSKGRGDAAPDSKGKGGDNVGSSKGDGTKSTESSNKQDDNKQPESKQDEDAKEAKNKKNGKKDKNPIDEIDVTLFTGIDLSVLSTKQIDSLLKVQLSVQKAKAKAEAEKRKKERKAARLARKNKPIELSVPERALGRIATMLKRVTVNYQEQAGTTLPGYLDSTQFLGVNPMNFQSNLGFAYGFQPHTTYLDALANQGKLSTDPVFNALFRQQFSQTVNVAATLEPATDLRVDLTMTKTFSKTFNELFKDTGRGDFDHLNPYATGSFNISYIGLKTIFQTSTPNQGPFKNLLDYRSIISHRLGAMNPYTNGIPDPSYPEYSKGYGPYSQDVLIPSFIAAYSGKDPNTIPLIDYRDNTTRSNPFRYFTPMPNWKITYNGLAKLPFFRARLNNMVINHSYTGTVGLNSFTTAMFYQDFLGVGFPSFIDSNSHNYVPYFQVPNITMTEQLNPLFGFDVSFKNNFTARFDFKKSRTVSLSLIDYQVSETRSTEYVIGFGYRKKGVMLPFPVFGIRKLKNDLTFKMDIGLRDDKTSNNYLAQRIDVVTRGQKVISISPSIDYLVNDKLTLRIFYDRRQTIPYVSSSFPMTNTKAGIMLRFIFAQ